MMGTVLMVATTSASGGIPVLQIDAGAQAASLVDGDGLTLYVYAEESDGTPRCEDECLATWLPVMVVDGVMFGEGVDLNLIGSVERSDDSFQLTYNGWPLYRHAEGGDAETATSEAGAAWSAIDASGDPVVANAMADLPLYAEGSEVYSTICAACHGAEGNGGSGPRLVGRASLENAPDIAGRLIRGFGYMPAFGDKLSDQELAAALTFVRNTWGNEFGAVTPEEVRSAR